MTDLNPTPELTPVPQLETNTLALGGTGNPMNLQAQALLNRDAFRAVQITEAIAAAESAAEDVEALAARASISVPSMLDLLALDPVEGQDVTTASFYPGIYALANPQQTAKGGARFQWMPLVPRTSHNGGTVVSPTVPWDGTQPGVAAFLAGAGETEPAGLGCWVAVLGVWITPEMFGAVGDDSAADDAPVDACINRGLGRNIYLEGRYAFANPVPIERARLRFQGGIDCRFRPWESTVPYLFNMVDNGEGTSFLRFNNIYFRGTPVQGGAWNNGIAVRAIDWPLTDCVFTNCWWNLSTNTTTGVLGRMFFTTFDSCLFEFCHRGIVGSVGYKNITISNTFFYKMAAWWVECESAAFSDQVTLNGVTGTNLDAGFGRPQMLKAVGVKKLQVEGCGFLAGGQVFTGVIIDLEDCEAQISDSSMEYLDAPGLATSGIAVRGNSVVEIANAGIKGTQVGVTLYDEADVTISDSSISDTTTSHGVALDASFSGIVRINQGEIARVSDRWIGTSSGATGTVEVDGVTLQDARMNQVSGTSPGVLTADTASYSFEGCKFKKISGLSNFTNAFSSTAPVKLRDNSVQGCELIASYASNYDLGPNEGYVSFDYGTAAPTTGTWRRGWIRYNLAPAASGKIGWVCVTAGTPGTWKTWGDIDA